MYTFFKPLLILGLGLTLGLATVHPATARTVDNITENNKGYTEIPAQYADVTAVTNNANFRQNQLTNVDGLANLQFVGGDLNLMNNQLSNINGLANLRTVNGILSLSYNQLSNVDALSGLQSVGLALSINNNQLTNVNGLANLQFVGDALTLGYNKLTNVDGLAKLQSVGSSLDLFNNQLTRVSSSLTSLTSVGYFIVSNNRLPLSELYWLNTGGFGQFNIGNLDNCINGDQNNVYFTERVQYFGALNYFDIPAEDYLINGTATTITANGGGAQSGSRFTFASAGDYTLTMENSEVPAAQFVPGTPAKVTTGQIRLLAELPSAQAHISGGSPNASAMAQSVAGGVVSWLAGGNALQRSPGLPLWSRLAFDHLDGVDQTELYNQLAGGIQAATGQGLHTAVARPFQRSLHGYMFSGFKAGLPLAPAPTPYSPAPADNAGEAGGSASGEGEASAPAAGQPLAHPRAHQPGRRHPKQQSRLRRILHQQPVGHPGAGPQLGAFAPGRGRQPGPGGAKLRQLQRQVRLRHLAVGVIRLHPLPEPARRA